jgi:subtilisin family serine protease
MEREYIVSLNRDIDYNQFWSEMEGTTIGHDTVPERAVDIVNERLLSLRNCHYALTDEEAAALRRDPRVLAVEIPPEQRDDVEIGFNATQTGVFNKSSSLATAELNWGLLRCNKESTNVFGTGTSLTLPYEYMLDGTGVDVVIQDSGIEPNHPEFFNYAGTQSRIQLINWYQVSGVPGTQSSNHYSDTHGHGTHCASTAVGLRHGWAKNARVYSVKVGGLEGGNGDSGTGIPVSACFDVIKGFHLNKPIDPVTGVRRPTIVNMSWGYSSIWSTVSGGVYRGTPWTGTTQRTDFGMIGRNGRFPVLIASVEVDMQELLDAGVHVCAAAGNDQQKIDVPGGIDYNNYFTRSGDPTPVYYHRGSSPLGDGRAMCVGALDSTVQNSTLDRKVNFSNSGPAVNIFAPGTNIQSATSTVTVFTTIAYTSPFPPAEAPPPPASGPYNVRLRSLTVSSNSYISQKDFQTYNDYNKGSLGAHILLGAEIYPTQNDASAIGVWAGTVSGGLGYKVRYEGFADFVGTTKLITWEVTFWQNNALEILLVRHDDASLASTLWGLYSEDTATASSVQSLAHFKNVAIQGASAVPRSMVLRPGVGSSWSAQTDNRVIVQNGNISIVSGVTVENGRTGLTQIMASGDELNVEINTPFDFEFFKEPSTTTPTIDFREARISGTSMASPQVCGVGAQLLQLRPELTPAQLRNLLIEYSTDTVFTTGLDNDYTNLNTLHDAPRRVLRQPFGQPADTFKGQFQNGVQFKRR